LGRPEEAGCETPLSLVSRTSLLETLEEAGCETPLSSASIQRFFQARSLQ
jgi:hypothetical protein